MRTVLLSLLLALFPGPALSEEPAQRQYTYAWMFSAGDAMAPRGGTTQGTPVQLAPAPSPAWQRLQEPGLAPKERDRRAILAMAGEFRTSFDFIETVGFSADYKPAPPYQTWGTEKVFVLADEPDFISLQHILVMEMADENGEALPPVVVKHWRQDWTWEARRLHTFRGHKTWQREDLSRSEAAGRWLQAVYQVDDTPRYQQVGRWIHADNYSSWHSEETWRPLPRREFSVRDDYHALVGSNRHTITPTGWVQEEHNLKVVLDEAGRRKGVLAVENGLARYERIDSFDWSAGDDYWRRTGTYWATMREVWTEIFQREDRVALRGKVDGVPLFMAIFGQAEQLAGPNLTPDTARREVEALLARYRRD